MRARALLRILKDHECVQVRQKGSHIRIECGKCNTTVPNHPGEELGIGLLKQIQRDLQRMVEGMKAYTVTYERDETGWWVATIKQVRGCHTQGRTIEQARKRVREALALYIDNAGEVKLVDDVRLPNKAQLLLQQVEDTRKRAEEQTTKLQESTVAAAKVLTYDLGVSMRDAGTILGLSHQRVHQLLLPTRKRSVHK